MNLSRLCPALLALLAIAGSVEARASRAAPAAPAAAPIPVAVATSAYDKAPWWMRDSVITQTGSVFSETPANRASFSATFLSVDDTADKAQAKAIKQTKALNEVLAKLGEDALRVTTSFSMRALYEQYRDKDGNRIEDRRGDKINGYEVSLNIALEIRDMSVLERAYALVLAAAPSQTNSLYFSLQPSNEMNSWLYTKAVEDAHARALSAVQAAGGRLGAIRVIDPTGRACHTDILARNAPEAADGITANDVGQYVTVTGNRRAMAAPPPPPPPTAPGSAEYLEARAAANSFIQTPPLQRIEQTACVVYSVE